MTPTAIGPGDAAAAFIKAIEEKVQPESVTLGYEWPEDGTEPSFLDEVEWYCDVKLGPGTHVRGTATGYGEKPMLEALADTARALGLGVRLRFEERP